MDNRLKAPVPEFENNPPAQSASAAPQVLILACGNTLRSDDGVGPFLANWAETRFANQPNLRVIARQQWTPELSEEIAHSTSVLFIDCALNSAPSTVTLHPVHPAPSSQPLATHHLGAAELLAMSKELYNSLPLNAQLLTIGAASTELGESFSSELAAALPRARQLIEATLLSWLA